MTVAAAAPPVWQAPSGSPGLGPFEGRVTADVAVIGAGFAGLAAALELVEAGRSVVVLEARDIAAGASAASAGQFGPLFYGARRTPAQVSARLGEERGERLSRMVAESGRWLSATIARHGIACEARQGYLCVYRSQRGLVRAADTFAQWQKFGGRSQRVGKDELPRSIGSDRYAGGFFMPDGGFINPVLLLAGLAAATSRAGVLVHPRSPVSSVRKTGDLWEVRVGEGNVTARHLLVATGCAGLPAWPGLVETIYAAPCGIAASAPLPDRGAAWLPEGGPVADMDDKAIFAPAVTADGRLLVSFLMTGAAPGLGRSPAPARRRLERVFAGRPAPPFETLSWGRIALTPDGLPRLLRGPDGMLAATGCNGLGLTLGIIAAREAARLILGAPPESLALPVAEAKPLPAARLMPAVLRNVLAPIVNRIGT